MKVKVKKTGEIIEVKRMEGSDPLEYTQSIDYGGIIGVKNYSRDEVEEAKDAQNLSFGEALNALKDGKMVSRLGWNGKGMFLWLKPETIIKSEWCKDPILKKLADENGGEIHALGTICMYTHDSTGRNAILTGWLASQTDMLSNDWFIKE